MDTSLERTNLERTNELKHTRLHIRLLGGFHLTGGASVTGDLGQARLQLLLAYLLVHRASPQSRRQLAFLFWPETSEKQAHTNLRKLIHMLRKALPNAEEYVEITPKIIQWRSSTPFTFDAADFETAILQANQAENEDDAATAEERLECAVGLYRGEFFPGFYEDWILAERDRLHQLYIDALARLSRICESRRDYDAAIGHMQAMLCHDPLHEANYRRLMRLYACNGDRAGALRIYHACADVLARELDVPPSPKTVDAYQRLMAAREDPSPETAADAIAEGETPLVGRQHEWRALTEAWRHARCGRPQVALISGETGIGKTRLADQLSDYAARQGFAVAVAGSFAIGEPSAFGPVVQWLRCEPISDGLDKIDDVWLVEASRLLPELHESRPDLPNPGPIRESWQKQRLYEALARIFLASDRPLLLQVDDLQWCDAETLAWLHCLVRSDTKARLMIVGTLRSEESHVNQPLANWRTMLQRSDMLTNVELGPLDAAETSELAAYLHRHQLTPDQTARFYRETEGHPLFIVEMARCGQTGAVAGPDGIPERLHLPERIQTVLGARLAALSPATRELAGMASVIGRDFTYSVLANAAEFDEDQLVSCLDELWQRRIIREQGADAYDFCHEKLRDVLYAGLSSVRRRLLHRRVAYALRRLHVDARKEIRVKIASHLEQAGLPSEARAYVRQTSGQTPPERIATKSALPAYGSWFNAMAI